MRRIAAFTFLALSVSIAAVSWAGPTPIKPGTPIPTARPLPTLQPPKLQITLPPSIVGVRRSLRNGVEDTSRYSGGGLSYDLEIHNPADTPLSKNLIIRRIEITGSVPPLTVPVNVPPKSRTWVTVADPRELGGVCGVIPSQLQFEGDTRWRTMNIIPSCTFTATTYDPNGGMLPDRIVAMRAGKLSFHTPKLDTPLPPACNSKIRGRATIQNNGSTRATGVHLKLDDYLVNAAERQSLTIEPGKSHTPGTFEATFLGRRGLHKVTIHGEGVPIYQWGWGIQVDRSCSLRFELG